MAPEILQNDAFNAAADVYSFGIVLGEMLSGEVPWVRADIHTTHTQITHAEIAIFATM